MLKRFRNVSFTTKLIASFLLIAVLFIGEAITADIAIDDVSGIYRHYTDYISPRMEKILEFHQQYTELRRLLGESFLNASWLETADGVERFRYEHQINSTTTA
ncbi:MAG: hypothetical protein FWE20_03950 [Defluviitaleaceae bacterium]|nr:hypothetical protein [Defluviitaleaceae bacterium]